MDRFDIARALREIGQLLELKGENPYKVRAYDNGARALEGLTDDLAARVDQGTLTEIDGIGEALAAKISELHRTGRLKLLDELRAEIPSGLIELAQVPDLGPKKALALHRALRISTLPQLKSACEAGLVKAVKGFGEKTEKKILDGLARYEKRDRRLLLADAREIADPLLAWVKGAPEAEQAELAGSLRRWRETVGDLDVVVGTRDPSAVMDRFAAYPQVERVEARGDTKCTVRLASGLQVDLRAVPPEDFATALHHFTGSKAHHVRLRGLARDLGLTISEWGVHRIETNEKLDVPTEAALYSRVGLPFIPPELREDVGEFEAAARGDRFDDLVTEADVVGMTHCHTVFSDGKHTVEEMARAADEMGMQYLTITDHSPTASYAGGVTLDKLKAQWDEIARVQELVKVRLLRGTESDILEDGALDYPDDVLERFDVVIASIHNRHHMDGPTMTSRLVAAMKKPLFKIWGHPLGRLLQQREPFDCRVEEVLDALAASKGAVEINGDPNRLDLAPEWIRKARERGLRFVLSTDAHAATQLSRHLPYAVHVARRGGVRRGEVLNARPAAQFLEAVRPTGA